MVAVLAGLLSTATGRAAEAERWADVVDRWQYGEASGPDDPAAEAWAALLRAVLCQHGVKQMRADADEAARLFAAESVPEPAAALMQGVARVLSGDLDGGDASLGDAASVAEVTGAPGVAAVALCERSLVAMARGEWGRAQVLAGRARTVLRQAGIEEYYATPLVCAVHARTALHRGDSSTARQELVSAQHLRPLLTYAQPHFAVQARIELARAHLALSDPAGAWTLMREVDELLRCRPDLGNLVGEAEAFRARLSEEHGPGVPGISALTAAELRVLADARQPPVISPDRRGNVPVSSHRQVRGDLDLPEARGFLAGSGGRPVPRARASAGVTTGLSSDRGDCARPGMRWNDAQRRSGGIWTRRQGSRRSCAGWR